MTAEETEAVDMFPVGYKFSAAVHRLRQKYLRQLKG